MVSKDRIFVVIFVILLLGGLVGTLYYFYKIDSVTKTMQNATINNIFLRIYNNQTQQQISTSYAVFYPEKDILERGQSLSQGILKVGILSNETFYLMSYNEGNETYYASLWNQEPRKILEDHQVDLYLQPYGSLKISQQTQMANGIEVNLTISPVGYLPELIPCLRWTANFITARVKNSSNYPVPQHLKNKVDRCFQPISSNSTITIKYDYFNSINDNEFIKIYFVDVDITKDSVPNKIASTFDGKDLGRDDIIYFLI